MVPNEIKDNAYAKFWGTNKVDCGEWCKFFDSNIEPVSVFNGASKQRIVEYYGPIFLL